MKIKEIELTLEEQNLISNINKNLNNDLIQNNNLFNSLNNLFENDFLVNNQNILINFKKILNSADSIYKNYFEVNKNVSENEIIFQVNENDIAKKCKKFNVKLININKLFVEKEKAESLNFLKNIRLEIDKNLEEKYINLYNENLKKLDFLLKDENVLKMESLTNDYKLIKKIKNLNIDINIFKKKHKWFLFLIIFSNIILLGVFIWILIIII